MRMRLSRPRRRDILLAVCLTVYLVVAAVVLAVLYNYNMSATHVNVTEKPETLPRQPFASLFTQSSSSPLKPRPDQTMSFMHVKPKSNTPDPVFGEGATLRLVKEVMRSPVNQSTNTTNYVQKLNKTGVETTIDLKIDQDLCHSGSCVSTTPPPSSSTRSPENCTVIRDGMCLDQVYRKNPANKCFSGIQNSSCWVVRSEEDEDSSPSPPPSPQPSPPAYVTNLNITCFAGGFDPRCWLNLPTKNK